MNQEGLHIQLEGQSLILDPEKAVFWEDSSFLLISDLHLGKVGHFRKNGIAVPVQVHHFDLLRLDALIERYQPQTVCFLGDLFHSELNSEWAVFLQWMARHPKISMLLVQGNHDILPEATYRESRLEVHEELVRAPFHFSHQRIESPYYNISGHIHPSIRLRGKGKQGVKVPCFYFSKMFGFLPAFGKFTGTFSIRPFKGDRIYATSGEEVIALMT